MFKCEKCGKDDFKNYQSYAGHLSQCGLKKKVCPICKRKINFYGISKHLRMHENDHPCKNCDKIIYGKGGKFCSQSCAAKFNNRKRKKKKIKEFKKKGINILKKAYCKNCGEELAKYNRKYCSSKCQHEHYWNLFVKEVKSQGFIPVTIMNKRAKKYILWEYGNKCKVCGGIEWMGKPIPLELDHIDGNWQNNKLENLRLVCGNCAMQLPTYKAKNKGNGRQWRLERYHKFKNLEV